MNHNLYPNLNKLPMPLKALLVGGGFALAGCGASHENVSSNAVPVASKSHEKPQSGNKPTSDTHSEKGGISAAEAQAILDKIRSSQIGQGVVEFPIKEEGEHADEAVRAQIEDLTKNYSPPLELGDLTVDQIVKVLPDVSMAVEVGFDTSNTKPVDVNTPLHTSDKLAVDFGQLGDPVTDTH